MKWLTWKTRKIITGVVIGVVAVVEPFIPKLVTILSGNVGGAVFSFILGDQGWTYFHMFMEWKKDPPAE